MHGFFDRFIMYTIVHLQNYFRLYTECMFNLFCRMFAHFTHKNLRRCISYIIILCVQYAHRTMEPRLVSEKNPQMCVLWVHWCLAFKILKVWRFCMCFFLNDLPLFIVGNVCDPVKGEKPLVGQPCPWDSNYIGCWWREMFDEFFTQAFPKRFCFPIFFSSGLLRISRARRMFRLLRFLQMFRLGLLQMQLCGLHEVIWKTFFARQHPVTR